jgi:hypothetical protein
MSHKLYPKLVNLNEDTHEYLDQNGLRYMGFSKFYDTYIGKEFNSAGAAYGVAKSAINKGQAMTAQAVLDQWEIQRDNGIKYDKAIQRYLETKQVLPDDRDIKRLVKSVCREYDNYHSTYCQSVVYNEYYRIGGSPDCFALTSNRQDGQFEMSDIKVFERQDNLHDHKGWLKAPLNHLSSTKFIKIALQLSFYAFQLEELLGKRCKKLFLHLICPITHTHQKIPIIYMRNDILLILEHNKEAIKEYSKKPEESLF